jgi:hypothetical protein
VTLGSWNGVEGDVNQDGIFNEHDVAAFALVWDPLSQERFLGGKDSYLHGDLNFDGDNNLKDVFELRQLLIAEGISAAGLEALFAVPEPQSWCLLMVFAFSRTSRLLP